MRRAPHQRRHLAEVVRHQLTRPFVEGLAVGRGEKPRDVAEAREVTMHVAPLPKREHLVDTDAGEPLRVGLDGVEDRDRFGVAHTGDNVTSLANVLNHGFRWATLLVERLSDRRWLRCGHFFFNDTATTEKA